LPGKTRFLLRQPKSRLMGSVNFLNKMVGFECLPKDRNIAAKQATLKISGNFNRKNSDKQWTRAERPASRQIFDGGWSAPFGTHPFCQSAAPLLTFARS